MDLKQSYPSGIIDSLDIPYIFPLLQSNQNEEFIGDKLISVVPRHSEERSVDELNFSSFSHLSSFSDSSPIINNIENEKIIYQSSITVKRLDIKIVGDTFVSDKNGNTIEEDFQVNRQEKTIDDMDDHQTKSLNNSYLWRHKVKL